MNARTPAKTLLALVVLLSVAATLGAVVAHVAPTHHRDPVKPRAAHVLTSPGAGFREPSRPASRPDARDIDITAHVNLYAVGGALACFALLAYWAWWQTHHRCPACGSCPAWCRCGEVTHRHNR
jgi:hypothetical protein